MDFEFKEELPNLIKATVKKISAETSFEVYEQGAYVQLDCHIIVTREIKAKKRTTEIRDTIPIDIAIPKTKLINSIEDTVLRLKEFQFDFTGETIVFSGEVEVTNISDSGSKREFDNLVEEVTK